ncbi:hypothetical protein OSB04_013177 [Centaurea solstitialis]|uniref:Reverse transcriptase zinc-binding domain-containing protein n=1 Tax=Centaurea solstitialis TaxID=347529 RepID=A0AA38TXH4_9ASTR|nr:hypothetical protein OSB04_013177 [Centaurea solstitialis]
MSNKGVWGSIATINKVIDKSNFCLNNLFQLKVGRGTRIRFWLDPWCGTDNLANRFPRLAAIDTNIGCSLADRTEWTTNGFVFRGCWRREIREGRETSEILMVNTLCNNVERWHWRLNESGIFSVASLRAAIDSLTLRSAGPVTVWNKFILTKVRIRNWQARIDRLPTKQNLMERGVVLDNDLCILCNEERETGDHILIRCRRAIEVRQAVNLWWNLLPSQPTSVQSFFEEIRGERRRGWCKIKEVAGQAYIWAVWNGRNGAIFNNKAFGPIRTANDVQSQVFFWCKSRDKRFRSLNWNTWCCNPSSYLSLYSG